MLACLLSRALYLRYFRVVSFIVVRHLLPPRSVEDLQSGAFVDIRGDGHGRPGSPYGAAILVEVEPMVPRTTFFLGLEPILPEHDEQTIVDVD